MTTQTKAVLALLKEYDLHQRLARKADDKLMKLLQRRYARQDRKVRKPRKARKAGRAAKAQAKKE